METAPPLLDMRTLTMSAYCQSEGHPSTYYYLCSVSECWIHCCTFLVSILCKAVQMIDVVTRGHRALIPGSVCDCSHTSGRIYRGAPGFEIWICAGTQCLISSVVRASRVYFERVTTSRLTSIWHPSLIEPSRRLYWQTCYLEIQGMKINSLRRPSCPSPSS